MQIPKTVARLGQSVADSAVTAILTSLVAGVAATTWVYLRGGPLAGLSVPASIMCGSVVTAAVATFINQIRRLDDRAVAKRLAERTPAQMEQQIWDWLKRYGFKLGIVPNPGCDFSLSAELPGSPPALSIVKMAGTPWVTILANLNFEEHHRDLVKERAPMLRSDMGIALIQLGGVEHDLLNDTQGRLAAAQVRYLLPFNANTTDLELLSAMRAVASGMKLIAELSNRVALIYLT